jgi:hypothetical protein
VNDPFVKNPCGYPDEVRARAPRGFREQVKRAAQAERITMSEFVRRAICGRVAAVTNGRDDDPPPFTPAAGQRIAA